MNRTKIKSIFVGPFRFLTNIVWEIYKFQVLVANIINQLLYGTSYPFENCSRLMNFVTTLTKIFITLFENPLTILAVVIPWIEFVPVLGYYSVGKHVEQLKKVCLYLYFWQTQSSVYFPCSRRCKECFGRVYQRRWTKLCSAGLLSKNWLKRAYPVSREQFKSVLQHWAVI